ncbi:MAG: helix-turn-helix transcriptional regulator [Clostridium sp.]
MEILSLGSKVKIKRKEKNMKLKDLAGDRITPGQISLIETGKSNPSEDLLKYLAEQLGTTVEYLLESESKQAEDVCKFYSDIVEASIYCKNYLRAEENIEKGLHYAEKYRVEVMKGVFSYQKAFLAFLREDYGKAQKYGLSSLIIFLKVESYKNATKCYLLLGEISMENREYSLALSYFKEAEKTYNTCDIDEKLMSINIYYNMARSYSKLNESVKAIDYALMVEKEVNEFQDHKIYSDTLMVLALAYSEKKEKEKALKYAEKAKNVCVKSSDIALLASVEEGIGEFLIRALNIEEGLDHLNRALDLKKSIRGENTDETIVKIIEGLLKCSKPSKALRDIEELEERNDISTKTRIKILECRYKLHKESNDLSKAEEQILTLLSFLEVLEDKEMLVYYYMLIGSFYEEIGEDKLSLRYFKKAFKTKYNK